MVKQLTSRIKQGLGITMQEFCQNHLKTDYRTFQYRMKTERYYPAEVIYICWLLRDKCENIFGKQFDELILFTGPEDTVAMARKIYNEADSNGKKELMSFIGMTLSQDNKIHVKVASPSPVLTKEFKSVEFKKTTPESFDGSKQNAIAVDEDLLFSHKKKEDPAPKKKAVSFEIVDINLSTESDELRFGK